MVLFVSVDYRPSINSICLNLHVPRMFKRLFEIHHFRVVFCSGGSRGEARGGVSPSPLFRVKIEEMTEGTKDRRVSKSKPGPPHSSRSGSAIVCLCIKTSPRAKSFIWKCVKPSTSFSCQSNLFSYERFCRKTRFETDAQGNYEMAHSTWSPLIQPWLVSVELKFITNLNSSNGYCNYTKDYEMVIDKFFQLW